MLVYKQGRPSEFRKPYRHLWRDFKPGFRSFSALDSHMDRITQGGFLVLRNHFRLTTLAAFRDGVPVIMATLFDPNPGWPDRRYPASIGAICARRDLREEEAEFFWSNVGRRHAELDPVGPMNGHPYLGFALPPPEAKGEHVGFQIGAPHAQQEMIFGRFRSRAPYRRHYTFETKVTPELVAKLEADLAEEPKLKVAIRRFSRLAARRDLTDLNRLVNQAFVSHFDFAPLTDEENWDILRISVPLLRSQDILFVEHAGRPVGFCFGMRDFNRVLKNDHDLFNLARLARPYAFKRARVIHKGVIPEYGGRGLIKQARHRIMLSYAREGVQVVENSYIDEGNAFSLKNVGDTFAEPLYEYSLHRLAR